MRPWVVTVPSALKPESAANATRAGEVISLGYDDETQLGFIEVPYERTLRDVDEARVWGDASAFVSRFQTRDEPAESVYQLATLASAYQLATRAYVAGHMSRLWEERRARTPIRRDQLGAIVRVLTGWPLFDMRRPLLGGES